MTTKPLQKAIDRYNKTGNLKPLARAMNKLLIDMATKANVGYEVRFLDRLPSIMDSLKSLDLNKKQ